MFLVGVYRRFRLNIPKEAWETNWNSDAFLSQFTMATPFNIYIHLLNFIKLHINHQSSIIKSVIQSSSQGPKPLIFSAQRCAGPIPASSCSRGALHDELRLRGATAAAALCQAADLGDLEESADAGDEVR